MAGFPDAPDAMAGMETPAADTKDAPTMPTADFFRKLRLDSLLLLSLIWFSPRRSFQVTVCASLSSMQTA